MLTIHGELSTRRIKWTEPKWEPNSDGRKAVRAIIVAYADAKEGLEFAHFSTQYGIDRKGRLVIPGFASYQDKHHTYTFLAPISVKSGKFPEDVSMEDQCRAIVEQLGKRLRDIEQWNPPAGYQRGVLDDGPVREVVSMHNQR